MVASYDLFNTSIHPESVQNEKEHKKQLKKTFKQRIGPRNKIFSYRYFTKPR